MLHINNENKSLVFMYNISIKKKHRKNRFECI